MFSVLILCVFLFHAKFTEGTCNTGAFTKVTVQACFDRRSPTRTYRDIDLQSLPNHYKLDVVAANVSGELCYRSIVNFPKLQHLSLINANITDIHIDAIDEVPNLKTLSLTLNKLTAVRRGQFSNIPSLETIYLSANKIHYVEENAFNAMPHLQKVYLDRNQIQDINGNWFLNSPQIKLVDLSYNDIAFVPQNAFKNIHFTREETVEYRLKHNKIITISDNVLDYGVPLVLHLERNLLTDIPGSVLNNMNNAREVYLNGNELDCATLGYLDHITAMQETPTIFHYDHFTCRKYVDS